MFCRYFVMLGILSEETLKVFNKELSVILLHMIAWNKISTR